MGGLGYSAPMKMKREIITLKVELEMLDRDEKKWKGREAESLQPAPVVQPHIVDDDTDIAQQATRTTICSVEHYDISDVEDGEEDSDDDDEDDEPVVEHFSQPQQQQQQQQQQHEEQQEEEGHEDEHDNLGRKELFLTEHEMPGLMNACSVFGLARPFKGLNINGLLHMTIPTGVIIETPAAMGANVRWASCNIFSIRDHAAAAIGKADTAPIFAWKGETLPEYWWCTEQMMLVPGAIGSDQLVDDDGAATLLAHKGKEFKGKFSADGSLPEPNCTDNPKLKCVWQLIKDSIQVNTTRYPRMAARLNSVSEETTAGVMGLKGMAAKGELLFPAININDCVTKSKFDNVYGCRHSLPHKKKMKSSGITGNKETDLAGLEKFPAKGQQTVIELQHGRVLMLACIGCMVPEYFKWFGIPGGGSIDDKDKTEKSLLAEINNGRFSMMAIIGMFFQKESDRCDNYGPGLTCEFSVIASTVRAT
eukprot:CAMPEP_0172788644 /NCGR_PEP_ID=MMETSP1074-20121228/207058_1 /TAXON_ID=2916 /ORGANISM="Ceratium fusus, Strain PA161109" /LENGTH=477 /DNA_ID=CAMNT_0013625675 /DNA_START=153 /DNA_END=1587 /DNA_ORIENTATION=-